MTKQVKRLRAKQQQAISLLLSYKNDTEVAQELGVARQTVNAWKNKNQGFAAELDRQQQELNQENRLQLSGLVSQSIQVLRQSLESEHECRIPINCGPCFEDNRVLLTRVEGSIERRGGGRG